MRSRIPAENTVCEVPVSNRVPHPGTRLSINVFDPNRCFVDAHISSMFISVDLQGNGVCGPGESALQGAFTACEFVLRSGSFMFKKIFIWKVLQ